MKSRLLASVAVCAAVMLGASGCAMLTPQGTTIPYSPGDGINVPDSGAPLQVRNAMIVATPDGAVGNLVAGVVNSTDEAHVLNIEVRGGGATIKKTLKVPANSIASLGATEDALRLQGLGVKPGATVPVFFQSGDAEGAEVHVPVLGGEDAYLNDLVPHPTATPKR